VHLDGDGVLEECVQQAAAAAEAPIALVTFVMRKIQLFRAAIGPPPELAVTRATSRCDSFCQFVVMTEGPFIVTNARLDQRLPQNMVETYGDHLATGTFRERSRTPAIPGFSAALRRVRKCIRRVPRDLARSHRTGAPNPGARRSCARAAPSKARSRV